MPLPALLGIGAGLVQSIVGGINARKAQKKLENLQSPVYNQNKSILDYYNTALQRYGASPSDSAMYKRNMQNINRNQATALSSLQDRRSALGGASSILRASNDAALNTEVQAENQRNQRFGELGNATNAKAGEDRMAFNVNEMQPFERKYNLLAMKAGANNQTANAGLSNVFNGLQNWSNTNMINKMYGDGGEGKSANSSTGATSNNFSNDWLFKNRKRKY